MPSIQLEIKKKKIGQRKQKKEKKNAMEVQNHLMRFATHLILKLINNLKVNRKQQMDFK